MLLRDAKAYYADKYRSGSKYIKSEGEFNTGSTSRANRVSGLNSDDGSEAVIVAAGKRNSALAQSREIGLAFGDPEIEMGGLKSNPRGEI